MQWNPVDYAKNSTAQLGWAQELIALCEFTGDEAVLDIGCGDGKITAEFAHSLSNGRVVGIDSSGEFIEYATSEFPPAQFPNLYFEQMDARAIAFDDPFDLAFSNAVLHWVDDHPAVLRGVAGALRPGGRLIISCGGAGNAVEVVAAFDDIVQHNRWRSHFDSFEFPYHFHAPADYEVWLEEAGFETRHCELVEKDMTHDGPAGIGGWLRTTWFPWTQPLPESLREEFIAAVVTRYLSQHPVDADGKTHVKMIRLEVDAIRK